MKKIEIAEYTYISHKHAGTIAITESDYEQYENGELDLDELMSKYEVNYDSSSDIDYDNFYFDGY